MTMITPSYLGETIEYSSLHACRSTLEDPTIDDVFAYAAKLGYSGLEIAPFTLVNSVDEISPVERGRIRELAARNNIEIAGIHWVLVKPEGLYINHPDRSIRERTATYFCSLVDFCGDIGGKVMVVGSPKQRNRMADVSADQALEWAAETFRDAVVQAEQRGVTICFEPLAPAETNFINTAAEAISFAQRLASARFQIILDVKAMCSESKSIPEIIRDSFPHFAHFHANDKNLKGPGFGESPLL